MLSLGLFNFRIKGEQIHPLFTCKKCVFVVEKCFLFTLHYQMALKRVIPISGCFKNQYVSEAWKRTILCISMLPWTQALRLANVWCLLLRNILKLSSVLLFDRKVMCDVHVHNIATWFLIYCLKPSCNKGLRLGAVWICGDSSVCFNFSCYGKIICATTKFSWDKQSC